MEVPLEEIAIIQKQVERALRGNLDAAKWLFAYYYGTPIQRNEHTGADGGPIALTWDTFVKGADDDNASSSTP